MSDRRFILWSTGNPIPVARAIHAELIHSGIAATIEGDRILASQSDLLVDIARAKRLATMTAAAERETREAA